MGWGWFACGGSSDDAVADPPDAAPSAPFDAAADVENDVYADAGADAKGDARDAESRFDAGAAVQIDVSSLFDVDVVYNDGNGYDLIQDAMDLSNFVLVTQSVVNVERPGSKGLPDDGIFVADTQHPEVRLAYKNTDNGNNARRIQNGAPITIDVPKAAYERLQIFGVSTEGSSALTFTLHYDDDSTDTRTATFPDWFTDPPTAGLFYLANDLCRGWLSKPPAAIQDCGDAAVFGYDVAPARGKVLRSIDVAAGASGRFYLLGATGD